MDIKARHLGPIASEMPESGGIEVDVSLLLTRLILFDQCVLESNRLKELPALLSVLGPSGLLDLMDAGALRVVCDAMTIAEVGRVDLESTARRGGPLPYGSFRLATVSSADRRDYVHRVLQEVHSTPLSFREQKRLKRDLADRLIEYPRAAGQAAVDGTVSDLRERHPVIGHAIRQTIMSKGGRDPGPFLFHVEELSNEGDFRIDVPVRDLGSAADLAHDVVQRALLNVAGLNQRIFLMEAFEATTGFKDEEGQLFRARLGVLASRIDTTAQEERFGRIVSLSGAPSLKAPAPGIDADKLLRLRETDEVLAFRAWLTGVDSQTDEEIVQQLAAVRPRLAGALQGRIGRAVRFLVATAAGLPQPAGLVLGPVASAVDTFLVDKVVGKPGPATFLGREYQSLFSDEGHGRK